MALARTYYSVNGEIIGEHHQGEANSRDYTRDSLGSIIAVYQNDWEIAEAIYKPYGEMIGGWNFSDYRFGWNGANGYRRTNMAWTTHYVRARHYSQIGANWTTRDQLWPEEMPYGYVEGMTMSRVDPSGQLPIRPNRDMDCDDEWNKYVFDLCNECARMMVSLKRALCQKECDRYANDYFNACGKYEPFTIPGFPKSPIPTPPKLPGPWTPALGPGYPPSIIIPYKPPCENSDPPKSKSQMLYDECIAKGYHPIYCSLQRSFFTVVNYMGGG